VKRIVERLTRAITDPRVRREMDAEDEVDQTITRLLNEKDVEHQVTLRAALQEKDATIQKKDAALEERTQPSRKRT
jgi:hypothetical protein